ncbi:MAG: dihydroorotate dehydrogenase-like protein [Spirochaetales bacterium]|nr:dihydroorotate dehydrogenase-like protein [Spirochaetales bacterium]
MADLKTSYLGIKIKNPVVAGASRLTANLDTIKELEQSGAAAVVCASLFEEQIQLKRYRQDNDLAAMTVGSDAEMARLFEYHRDTGPEEHLMWIKKTKDALDIPVIGSLNAVHDNIWTEYARKIQDTGADALECNFYFVPDGGTKTPAEIEMEQLKTMEKIRKAVSIPIAVKLSYFYSNPPQFIARAAGTGVNGFVLFNRLFEPDISVEQQKHVIPLNLSNPGDNRLSLRYTGLLFGRTSTDFISSTGIFDGKDVIKAILSGANTVQIVSTLYRNGIGQIRVILDELSAFMEANGLGSLSDFRGKLAGVNVNDPFVYKRAQYISMLLRSDLLQV